MRMEDFTKAFPKKVNIDQYKPIIEAATKASKGEDGLPRVVVEEYDTYKIATKAANAIRSYCKANNIGLRVSCPENGKLIRVYKSDVSRKPRKKKETGATPTADAEEKPAQAPA